MEAKVALQVTVNELMSNKGYYQMCAHTLVENAVFLLLWGSFEEWILCERHDTDELSSLSMSLSAFCDVVNKFLQCNSMDEIEKAKAAAQSET